MKRIISLVLLLSLCLCSCLVKKVEETPDAELIYVSEPIEELRYTVAFRETDADLAYAFDYVLGEVLADGTAAKLSKVHIGEDMTDSEPLTDKIRKKNDGSVERVEEAGKLVIGYNKQNAPLAWIDASQKAVGFEPELAKEIGRRMGITVEFKVLDWSRAEGNLESGEVDALMSAFVFTEERAERFNLTRTYLSSSMVLISRKEEPAENLSDLTNEKIAVSKGSYQEAYLTENGFTPTPYSTTTNAYEKVKGKSCAALLADKAYVYYLESGHR